MEAKAGMLYFSAASVRVVGLGSTTADRWTC